MKKVAAGSDEPRVLFVDLETAPNLGFAWEKWDTNIIENLRDWYILSFSFKWLGQNKIHAFSLPDFSLYQKSPENDKALVQKLWEVFNEADIIVAHNGDEFDIKKSNARFIAHDLRPPTPYKTIDTKKVAKQSFRFDSNKLDELGRYFGIGRKLPHTGFHLWRGCMTGDKKSWSMMVKYNKQDVALLEKVYLKMLPWMKTYPIVRKDNGSCRHCESVHLQRRGFSYTKTHEIQRLQCTDCGAWGLGERRLVKE